MTRWFAIAVLLLGAGVAQAQVVVDDDDDDDRVVAVERGPSTMGIITRSALGGAVLGTAIAGGVIGYEMVIEDNEDYEWEETLLWGAGIGLAAGLVWGIVDATTGPTNYGRVTPLRDGYSTTLDLRRVDQSGKATFPLLRGRF